MNHGIVRRTLRPLNMATPSVTGTIHKARVSFTVVATARATLPYLAAAPTTELVSWMANAAQSPNWVSESETRWPIIGKTNSAAAFRMNTVPSETAMSSSLASSTGPTAAIALPPQMAVPTEIKSAGVRSTENNLPSSNPEVTAKVIPTAVYRNPARPARSTWPRFMPKPSPTTETCNSSFDHRPVNSGKPLPTVSATAKPIARARGGDEKYAEQQSPTTNANLRINFNNQNSRDESGRLEHVGLDELSH